VFVERVVAGVVTVACVFDEFKDIVVDRETGGPIAMYRPADKVFEQFPAACQIVSKCVGSLNGAQVMVDSMGGDLMAAGMNLSDQSGQFCGLSIPIRKKWHGEVVYRVCCVY
jgi:hypothetical protein